MKRIFVILNLIIVALCTHSQIVESVKIHGVEYFRYANRNGLISLLIDTLATECTILPEVEINSKKYIVTDVGPCGPSSSLKKIILPNTIESISDNAFYGCTSLIKLEIPNSVKDIGECAFYNCKSLKSLILPNTIESIHRKAFYNCEKLESIVIPDKSEIWPNKSVPFVGCSSLQKITGHTIKYPQYIIEAAGWNSDIPFSKKIPQIKSSFTYFAQERIMKEIEIWQKKKEYETSAQWQARVTEANRAKKVQEFTERAKQEYIAKYTKGADAEALACNVGYYDADYGIFPITDETFGTFYASVPQAEAENFKNNFSSVKITPEFGIKDDHIGVIAATFTLGDKVYRSAENFGNAGADKDIAINLPPLQINLSGESSQQTVPTVKIDNSIDLLIPQTAASNTNTFAVIIGNENYTQVAKVPYANNDAKVFAEYCKKTLGLPGKNVKVYTDASFGTILEAMNNISAIATAYKGDLNVIFYYAGHGVPNESTGDAYLLPVDASGRQTEACYPLDRLYGELGGMQARSVVAFIDACFSGSERGNGMLASARGVAIKAKDAQACGNMVVFSAATGDQTAYPYNEKGHGMFTYFLLKKLQETKGEATLGEIGSYVSEQVARQSVVVNSKSQTPTVMPSATMADNWQTFKLK